MDIAHFVDSTGIKENALGRGRLAGINVRGDTDVTGPFQWKRTVLRINGGNVCLVGNDKNGRRG